MRTGRFLLSVLIAALIALNTTVLAQEDQQNAAIFLVAKPQLHDPNFRESVVLVLRPPEGGAIGVILNRPTPVTLGEAFAQQPRLSRRNDILHFGGPVQTSTLMFLFRQEQPTGNAMHVIDDLYLSADAALLDTLLAQPEPPVRRFFLGYSGWAPEQLETEISLGGWYVLPADADTALRDNTDTLWRDLLLRATAVHTFNQPNPVAAAWPPRTFLHSWR